MRAAAAASLLLLAPLAAGCHTLLPFGPAGSDRSPPGDIRPAQESSIADRSVDLGPRVTVSGTVGQALLPLVATLCKPLNPALDCKGTLFVAVYRDDILFPDPAKLLGWWSKENLDLSSTTTLVPFSIEIPSTSGWVTFHTFLSEEPAKHSTLHTCDPWCLTGVPQPGGKDLTGVTLSLEGRWDELLPWTSCAP